MSKKCACGALTAAGCHVVSVETVSAALFEISMGLCEILLLCHKLDHARRCTLAEFFQQNCPDLYIIAVLAQRTINIRRRPVHALFMRRTMVLS